MCSQLLHGRLVSYHYRDSLGQDQRAKHSKYYFPAFSGVIIRPRKPLGFTFSMFSCLPLSHARHLERDARSSKGRRRPAANGYVPQRPSPLPSASSPPPRHSLPSSVNSPGNKCMGAPQTNTPKLSTTWAPLVLSPFLLSCVAFSPPFLRP